MPADAEYVSSRPSAVLPAGGRLDDLLRENDELVWLLAGDDPQLDRDGRLSISQMCWIRNGLNRPRDILIDATVPAEEMADLIIRFKERIARFQPHVVVVTCSPLTGQFGPGRCEAFESALITLLRRIQSLPAIAIVQTPLFVPAVDESRRIDELVYIEAIRGCTAEHDVLLVDHWEDEEVLSMSNETPPNSHARSVASPLKTVKTRMNELLDIPRELRHHEQVNSD